MVVDFRKPYRITVVERGEVLLGGERIEEVKEFY